MSVAFETVSAPPFPSEPIRHISAPVTGALAELLSRYARTHGPFRGAEAARRLGVSDTAATQALGDLLTQGRVEEGCFRPGGIGREWCAAGVLATLRRRSLARLRRQAEPTEPEALSRLLLDWQSITAPPASSPDALLDIVEQLQGAIIPASVLETDILPARLHSYRPTELDALTAAGEVVLVGCGRLGEHDGRLALFLAEDAPLLRARLPGARTRGSAADERAEGAGREEWPPLHRRLLNHMDRAGASFFGDLFEASAERLPLPVLDALWDLFWAGEATNDSPSALRAFLSSRASRTRPSSIRPSSFRSRRATPPSGVGRWSRLPPLATTVHSDTERLAAQVELLLLRNGVLTRASLGVGDVPGGFATLYPVLRAMEEAGRIRRGYFVAGLGGLQFAHPGALERLRILREAPAESDPGGGPCGGGSR